MIPCIWSVRFLVTIFDLIFQEKDRKKISKFIRHHEKCMKRLKTCIRDVSKASSPPLLVRPSAFATSSAKPLMIAKSDNDKS